MAEGFFSSFFVTINLTWNQNQTNFHSLYSWVQLHFLGQLKSASLSISGDNFWGFTYWCLTPLSCKLLKLLSYSFKRSWLANPHCHRVSRRCLHLTWPQMAAYEVYRTQVIDLRDESGLKDPLDPSLGPQLPRIRNPRLLRMLKSEVNIFWCLKI